MQSVNLSQLFPVWKCAVLAGTLLFSRVLTAADSSAWVEILQEARGQTVYFHTWGGDNRINAHLLWVAREVNRQFGLTLRQVKLADTADAVTRVLTEKAAGRTSAGAVDLLWLNGENFSFMRENDLLYGPWASQVPNWHLLDLESNPGATHDAGYPLDGFELPWTRAQLLFYFDANRLTMPPGTPGELLGWLRENPGRFTYPRPPDFIGTSFLKQLLLMLSNNHQQFTQAPERRQFDSVTAPLWRYLEQLHPLLWRDGRTFPGSGPRLRQLLADAEIDLALTFNAGEIPAAIENFELPDSVQSYAPQTGTLANTSYLAIPFNASARAGAIVVANFLISPEVQARQQDNTVWGTATVLAVDALPDASRDLFDLQHTGLPDARALPEMHPQWTRWLEAGWEQRFGVRH